MGLRGVMKERGKDEEDKRRGDKVYRVVVDSLDSRAGLFNEDGESERV